MKRKSKADEALNIASEELRVASEGVIDDVVTPDAEAPDETPVEDPVAMLYVESAWKGLPQWRCRVCPWDTLKSEEEMRKHIEEVHLPPPAKPERVALPIVDKYGQPVVVKKSGT